MLPHFPRGDDGPDGDGQDGEIEDFNPFHDPKSGEFTTGGQGGGDFLATSGAPDGRPRRVATGVGGDNVLATGAEAAAIQKEWKDQQVVEGVEDMHARASGHQDQLVAMAGQIARTVDRGTKVRNPGVKTLKSLTEKVVVRGKKVNEITNSVRLGFEANGKPEDADKIVAHLANDDHLSVADEGWRSVIGSGYFDRTAKVRFPSGIVGEVQIWVPGMYPVKEEGHKLYEESRTLYVHSPEAINLRAAMSALYEGVKKRLPPEWQAVVPR